jgi:hypothetical protein
VLAVTDTQVQKLYFVLKNAEWTFELRPVVDAADSSERMESLNSVVLDGMSDAQWQHFIQGARNFR